MNSIADKIAVSKKTGEIEFFIKERKADCVVRHGTRPGKSRHQYGW